MKEALENELRDVSPFLADLKKQRADDAFKTPKYYFDNLADTVLAQAKMPQKVAVESVKRTPQYKSLFERFEGFLASVLQPKTALAFGSLALVAVAGWYALMPKTNQNQTNSAQIATIPTENTPQPLPNLDTTTPVLPSKNTPHQPMAKTPIDAPKLEKYTQSDDNLAVQNPPKAAYTEGSSLTHPESGLTAEEIEIYLADTLEESDLDGSDNNF
jgi:hypothetical protein